MFHLFSLISLSFPVSFFLFVTPASEGGFKGRWGVCLAVQSGAAYYANVGAVISQLDR